MEYNDEQILNVEEYEIMAKAYASELKKRGFMLVQVDNEKISELISTIFEQIIKIKSYLFMLGGFLNTSSFYSLNERQIKKLSLLFELSPTANNFALPHDKTKCFLAFLSCEFELIKNLIELSDKSNYEVELKKIINSRLSLLSKILSF